jgi:hypothetical protein
LNTRLPKIGSFFIAVISSVVIGIFTSKALAKGSGSKLMQLQAMDAILDSAGSLENFLKSDLLIEQYYEAARAYYVGDQQKAGDKADRFPRESFHAILASFRDLLKRHPEFAERAWKKRQVRPPLVIKTVQKGYGISQASGFRSKFASELGLKESDFSHPVPVADLAPRLEQIMSDLHGLMDQTPTSRQEKIEQGERLKAFKYSETARLVRADLLRQLLTIPELNARFRSTDADIVFGAYSDMRSRARQFLPEPIGKYARAIDFLMSTLVNPEGLASNRELFAAANVLEKTDNSEFEFVEISRAFHSLFRGLYWRECTGGDCTLLHWLHESRYGIPLLEGGREIHVLRDGDFTGYISNVLVERDHRHYFALEVITPYLKNRILTWKFADGQMRLVKRSVLDVWIDHEMNDNPPVEGFLVGQSRALNSGGGLEAIRLSEAWMSGKTVGHSNTFKPVDPLAPALVERPKSGEMNEDYLNSNLIFELGVIPANEAVLLKPAEFDFAQLNQPLWIEEQFRQAPEVEAKFWSTLFFHPQLDIQGRGLRLMARAWAIMTAYSDKYSADHAAAKKFMEKCEDHCIRTLFRYAFPGVLSLKEFEKGLHLALAMPERHRDSLLDQFSEEKWQGVVAHAGSNLSSKDIKRLLRLQTWDMAALLMIYQARDYVTTMSDFLWLTDHPRTDGRILDTYSKFFVSHLRWIQSLRPTTRQWWRLYERLTSARDHFLAVTVATEQARDAGEFLSLLMWPVRLGRESQEAKYEQDRFLLKQAHHFMRLKPSFVQKWFYLNKIYDNRIYNRVSDILKNRVTCVEILEN